VHHRVGAELVQQVEHHAVVLGHVKAVEGDLTTRELLPCRKPRTNRLDRRQRIDFELDVDFATRQVVNDGDFVALGRKMQRRRPAAETVSA